VRSSGWIKCYGPFEPILKFGQATGHPRHQVAILYLPKGKHPPETPLNILAGSNGRIKCYGPFEPILHAGQQDVPVTV